MTKFLDGTSRLLYVFCKWFVDLSVPLWNDSRLLNHWGRSLRIWPILFGKFMKKTLVAMLGLVLVVSSVSAVNHYVALEGGHVFPYTNWASSATGIQDAVAACTSGDVVWVTNGVYSTGGQVQSGCSLLTRVLATNGSTIRSVNGPALTVIDGGSVPYGDTNAVRTVFLSSGSRLEGFTLRGGSTLSNNVPSDMQGGGVYVSPRSVVSNCIIKPLPGFEWVPTTYGGLQHRLKSI